MATLPTSDSSWTTWNYDTISTHSYNNSIWDSWNTTTTASISTSTPTDYAWVYWQEPIARDDVEVRLEYDGTVVWRTWISNDYTVHTPAEHFQKIVDENTERLKTHKLLTTEQIRARKVQVQINHQWNKILNEEKEQEKAEAELTAKDLLLDLIGENELKRYQESGHLLVKGKHYDYLVRKDGGLYRLEKGKVAEFVQKKTAKGKYICVHSKESYTYPPTDNVITLKLWLENAEDEVLKIGNHRKYEDEIKDFDKVACL